MFLLQRNGSFKLGQLFERIKGDWSEDFVRITRPGTLYKGKAGLRRERWEFWEMRFMEVSTQVDEDVGKRALRAAREMRRLSGREV